MSGAQLTKAPADGGEGTAVPSRSTTPESQAFPLHTEMVTVDANMGPHYPKKLGLHPLKVRQVKTLVYAPDDEYYYDVCANVVKELTDFDVLTLALMDFDKVLLFLRVNSCGGTITYTIKCPKCEKVTPKTVDLTKLFINAVDKDYQDGVDIGGMRIGLPRLGDRIAWGHWVDQHQKDSTDLDRLVLYMRGGTIEERLAWFDDAAPLVIQRIQEITGGWNPAWGVNRDFEFKCLQKPDKDDDEPCGYTESMSMPFRGEFFLPDNPRAGDRGDRGD